MHALMRQKRRITLDGVACQARPHRGGAVPLQGSNMANRKTQRPTTNAAPANVISGLDFLNGATPATFWPALVAVDALEANLTIWRSALDSGRRMMRAQQDFLLHAWRMPFEHACKVAGATEESALSRSLFMPVLEATKAIEESNEALWAIQLRRLSQAHGEEAPH
jgi:hypothetical protein